VYNVCRGRRRAISAPSTLRRRAPDAIRHPDVIPRTGILPQPSCSTDREDQDAQPTNHLNCILTKEYRAQFQWSQEFKLSGKNSPTDWVGGLSYYDDAHQTSQLNFSPIASIRSSPKTQGRIFLWRPDPRRAGPGSAFPCSETMAGAHDQSPHLQVLCGLRRRDLHLTDREPDDGLCASHVTSVNSAVHTRSARRPNSTAPLATLQAFACSSAGVPSDPDFQQNIRQHADFTGRAAAGPAKLDDTSPRRCSTTDNAGRDDLRLRDPRLSGRRYNFYLPG